MKNMMRRTVAFMLMACLLLSVMAPAALAITDNGDGSYTYTFAYDIASGNERPTLSSAKFTGDFVAVARNNSNVKTSATVLQFQSAATTGDWYALKFNVGTAGYYNIGFNLSTQDTTATGVDLHILAGDALAYEANNADNQTAIDGSTPIASTELIKSTSQNPTVERVHFETAGDYLLVIEMTTDPASVVNFTGFTMTDVTEEVEAELAQLAAFRPALVEGSYVYTWSAAADTIASNGYATAVDNYYGNFAGHANSSSSLWKPQASRLQIQSSRVTGYTALRFNVPVDGTYNISLDISGGAKILDVFFVDPANMATGNGAAANTTYVDGLTGGQRITVGSDVETITKVTLSAGDHLMVWRLADGSVEGNVNFFGMTLSPWVAPDVATATTTYDFTNLGALVGAAAGDHAYFVPTDKEGNEVLDDYQALYDAGKINYMPYAERPGEVGGTVFTENGQYNYGIFAQHNGKGGFFALKIANPGVGTYNFATDLTTGYANATAQGQVYVIPVSAVEAAMTASQVTASEAIYNLIQGDYAGKHITEGSFRTNASLTGTVEIKSAEDHIVVYYAASIRSGSGTTAWMHVKNFTLFNSYKDINAALAATDSKFDTVTLLEDVDLDGASLTVSTGAVLDLNGNALDAKLDITNGSLEDSSNGAGSVSSVINVAKDNGSVLIKEGDSVKAYNYTAKQNGYKASETKENVYEFWFDADFADDVYAKLTPANGFTIGAELKLNGDTVAIVDMDAKVQEWISNKGLTATSENAGLGIEITGMETLKAGDTITVTPILTDAYGTSAFGGAITYTAPAAAE